MVRRLLVMLVFIFPTQWHADLRRSFVITEAVVFTGTLVAVTYAYLTRFLTISFSAVEASLGKITLSMDLAARSLGRSPSQTLGLVHLPIMRGTLLTATILVFVDVLKELPATLVLRPFNFDTLATRTYDLASDERLVEAAGPALAIGHGDRTWGQRNQGHIFFVL